MNVNDDLTLSPLQAVRDNIADLIDLVAGIPAAPNMDTVGGFPAAVVTGNGWKTLTTGGQLVAYECQILVLYASSGGTAYQDTEECARRVYVALRDSGYTVGDVPAPEPFTLGADTAPRQALAVRMTAAAAVNPSTL